MDENLTKSITDLIDETLQELDELRKSRFSAAEIKLDGPGDGIAGKPANGHLDAKKAEDEDEKDEDHDEDHDDDDMDKGENEQADPGDHHHGVGKDKPAGPRELSGGGKVRGKEGHNSAADPGEIHKADDEDEDDKDIEKSEDDPADDPKVKRKLKDLMNKKEHEMKKSLVETEELMKSYVEERVRPLEDKLSTILDLVNKIADQPVAARGVTVKTAPLFKSTEEFGGQELTKSVVANKLFELKKSGTRVDSLDIAKVEMGQDLRQIIKKYEIS